MGSGAILVGGALAAFAGHQLWHRVITMSTVTPVARLIAELLEPEPNMSVYDPGFGIGRLLSEMELNARSRSDDTGERTVLQLVGRECDPLAFSVGAARLAAAGIEATLVLGDSLGEPGPVLADPRGFDRVVANPTWEQPLPDWISGSLDNSHFPYGMPPRGCADWAWVQHGLVRLAPDGRMAIVLDEGALRRHGEQQIREAIVDSDLLEAVIVCEATGGGRAASTRVLNGLLAPAALLLFNRAKRHRGEVLFVDAAALVARNPLRIPRLTAQVVDLVRCWEPESGVAAVCDRSRIAQRNFDLRPGFYVA